MTVFSSIAEGKFLYTSLVKSFPRRPFSQEGALLSVEVDDIMAPGTGEDEPQSIFSICLSVCFT